MEGNGGNEENDFPSSHGRGVVGGRRYAPVVAHDNDRAVLEMSSLESAAAASSSSPPFPTGNPPYIPSLSFFLNIYFSFKNCSHF